MSAQGHSAGRRRELDALATGRTSVLPFLPTLVTAIAVAAVSLLCRPPESPETEKAAPSIVAADAMQAGLDGIHRPADTEGPVSAAIAFGRLYPVSPADRTDRIVAASVEKPAQGRTARSSRRPCGTGRCADAQRAEDSRAPSGLSRMAEDAASLPAPFRVEPEPAGGLVPDGVLPFAPTAAALVDGVEALGGRAASLGSALGTLVRLN